MFRYAQIDENGIVVSDSHLSGEVISDHMIRIAEDFDLVNKKYNKASKSWEIYTPLAQPPQATTEERLVNMENTLDLILLKQEGLL